MATSKRGKRAAVDAGIKSVFAKTEAQAGAERMAQPSGAAQDNSDLDAGNIRTTGVGLKAGEIAAIDALATELGIRRNALMRFAIRHFLIEYRAGKIDMQEAFEVRTERKLRMP